MKNTLLYTLMGLLILLIPVAFGGSITLAIYGMDWAYSVTEDHAPLRYGLEASIFGICVIAIFGSIAGLVALVYRLGDELE